MASLSQSSLGVEKPLCLENLRHYHENEKQWKARKEFMARHFDLYPGKKLDQLIALSTVWSNIVFIGNRYGAELTEKVHQMGEGIDVGEMRSYELVPGAKAAKRPSSDEGGQPLKKKFGPRPRFEPVHFVVSTVEDDKVFQKTREPNVNIKSEELSERTCTPDVSAVCTTVSDHSDAEENNGMELGSHPFIYDSNDTEDQYRNDSGNFMMKTEQDYSAKFESHYSSLSKDFRSSVLDGWQGVHKQGRKGIGFVKPQKTPLKAGIKKQHVANNFTAHPSDKFGCIKQLSAIVKHNMVNPQMFANSNRVNFTHVLTQSIQACKANPEYIYVAVKDIPKHRTVPPDGFACEVRFQDIYLGTGYSFSKLAARDRAAEVAIQLLQNDEVDIATVQRKGLRGFCEDIAACSIDTLMDNFPPFIKQAHTSEFQSGPSSEPSLETTERSLSKPWSQFLLVENASDAVGILNNSATFNKMAVNFKHDMVANNRWRCSVFVQDRYIAEGYGNKKFSKQTAAEAAVKILKTMQPNAKRPSAATNTGNHPVKELKDIVVYENATNPVCTLNDTAQFNKVSIDYVFEWAAGLDWTCKVLINQQFVAEAVGLKKTVKYEAAEAAVKALKRTQPVIVNNLKKGPVEDAISRNQIRGVSNEGAYKQKIKEDNIGNQLLRKMGWTGGGLGKGGEGIAEPIAVKEQFSREGLGLMTTNQKITKRDIDLMIRNYAASCNQDDLTFSRELTNEERKYIHQIAQRYGLKSKSHGQGTERFLVVSRKRTKDDLIHQLIQEGQVGSYAIVMPH